MKRGLIVLNGRPPGRRLLRSLTQQADLVVAADAGAHSLLDAEIPFQFVVGDLDSLDRKRLAKQRKVQVVEETQQEDSDFEKSLRWVLANTDARDLVFTGGMGDEFDHVLTHLSIACKFAGRARLRQVEDSVIICFVNDGVELNVKPGTQVSLVALGVAEGVRTEGLRWPLNGERLALGVRDGLHNLAEETAVRVTVRDGCLAVLLRKTKGEAFRW